MFFPNLRCSYLSYHPPISPSPASDTNARWELPHLSVGYAAGYCVRPTSRGRFAHQADHSPRYPRAHGDGGWQPTPMALLHGRILRPTTRCSPVAVARDGDCSTIAARSRWPSPRPVPARPASCDQRLAAGPALVALVARAQRMKAPAWTSSSRPASQRDVEPTTIGGRSLAAPALPNSSTFGDDGGGWRAPTRSQRLCARGVQAQHPRLGLAPGS